LNLPHIHLLLNHWPIIGTFAGFGLLFLALVMRSDDIKQAAYGLFALMALVAIPVYLSGNAAESATRKLGFTKSLVEAHEGAALIAFIFIGITGLTALYGLWRYSRNRKESSTHVASWVSMAVFVLAIVTAGLMAVAGTTGGDIRHPEIIAEGEQPSAIGVAGADLVLKLRYFIIDYSRWIWPLVETAHFLGLILIVGSVGLLNLRVLGFFRQLPVSSLQRLLPWGIVGLVVNVITGFLFFIGMPFFYVFNTIFQAKILFILLAGGNLGLFYCTGAIRKLEPVDSGQEAPVFHKLVALSSLVLWIVVVVIGRYIPLGESAG
jgi:uncharacterized membrane protein YidH (DUF202 family)